MGSTHRDVRRAGRRRVAPGVGLAAAVLATALASAQGPDERPLPDARAFFEATRANLARAQRAQYAFAYKERTTELRRNPFGRVGTGGTRAFLVTPLEDGTGLLRQLIERDGVPVENGEVERIDYEEPERRGDRPRRSPMDDVVAVLDFAMDRRERVDGRDTIVVRFEPRADAEAETRQGELARAFEGDIWVDELAREVVRVEATAVESISIGFGLVARLKEGSSARLDRAPVAERVWLPTGLRFTGEGRAFLFVRRLTIDHVVEWFDYERVPVRGLE